MNLTASSALGRLIRLPLRLLPGNAVVTVLSGINRGLLWRVGSSAHGCWIGSYERDKQRVFADIVKPGTLVFDVGAQAGFYTLAALKLRARVVAFEPSPVNIRSLQQHLRINGLQADVREVAASHRDGSATFDAGPSISMGRLHPQGGFSVNTVALDSLGLVPDAVKMDIEGGELAALQGARKLIAQRKTTWLIALDDAANRDACIAELAGYRIREFAPNEIIAVPD